MAETPQDDRQRSDRRKTGGESQSELRAWYRLTGVGVEFIVAVLMFGGIGWWIDTKADSSPWFLLVGLGLGFATGLYMMIRAANRLFHD